MAAPNIRRRSKILLCGSFGQGDVGAEAFLHVQHDLLASQFDIAVAVDRSRSQPDFSSWWPYTKCEIWEHDDFGRIAGDSSLRAVHIGGSNLSYGAWGSFVLAAIDAGRRTLVTGVDASPAPAGGRGSLRRQVIEHLDLLSVRFARHHDALTADGIAAHLGADWTLGLQGPALAENRYDVLLAVDGFQHRSETWCDGLLQVVTALRKAGRRVDFLPLAPTDMHLFNRIGIPDEEQEIHWHDPRTVFDLVLRSRFVVSAGRIDALILALKAGIGSAAIDLGADPAGPLANSADFEAFCLDFDVPYHDSVSLFCNELAERLGDELGCPTLPEEYNDQYYSMCTRLLQILHAPDEKAKRPVAVMRRTIDSAPMRIRVHQQDSPATIHSAFRGRFDSPEALVKWDDMLSQMVPPHCSIVVISPALGTFGERLAQGRNIRGVAIEAGHVPGWKDDVERHPQIDCVVMRYGLETLADPLSVLTDLSRQGLPLVCCYFQDHEIAALHQSWAPWRHKFDDASFEQLAQEAGYRVEFDMTFVQATACFLLPRDRIVNADWWKNPEGSRFLARRRKRADRLKDSSATMQYGRGIWRPSPKWQERAIFVADLIPKGLHVLDIGCGGMDLERYVDAKRYVPLDRVAHDERTIVVDLNDESLPLGAVRAADLVTALGVLEYIADPKPHFDVIAAAGVPLLCTYNVGELRRNSADDGMLSGWVTQWTTEDLTRMLRGSGFAVIRAIEFGGRQKVFVCLPESQVRPQWWDDLGSADARRIEAMLGEPA